MAKTEKQWSLGRPAARASALQERPLWLLLAGGLMVFWLIAAPLAQAAESPVTPPEVFRFLPAASLPGPVAAHSATRLAKGPVVVIGGYNKLFGVAPAASNQIRLYDSARDQWTVSKATLRQARLWHGAAHIPNTNLIVVAGGLGQDGAALSSLELYSPALETAVDGPVHCLPLPPMRAARASPRLNPLADGRVLITGDGRTAELIEPDPNNPRYFRVRPVAALQHADRSAHSTVTLANGQVVLLGGRSQTIERFDPQTESFRLCAARLPQVLDDLAAMVLYDGTILLAGGQRVYTGRCVDQCWIYDPRSDELRPGPQLHPTSAGTAQPGASDMMAVDLFETRAELAGRFILLAGGEYDRGGQQGDAILDSAWIYDAAAGQLSAVGPMRAPHDDFAAVALPVRTGPDGELTAGVLLIAGHKLNDLFQSQCERFEMRFVIDGGH